MKKFAVFIIMSLVALLGANDFVELSWNKADISSRYQFLWLEKNPDENRLLSTQTEPDHFALSSLAQAWKNYTDKTDNSNFISWQIPLEEKSAALNLRFYAGADFQHNFETEENYYYYNYAVKFTGNIKNQLFYYANWYMGKYNELNSLAVNSALVDTWYQPSSQGEGFYLDNMTAKLQFNTAVGEFAVGRGRYEIGSNISGSVILSDETNDYGYFSHNITLGDFQLSFLHSTLIADSTHSQMNSSLLYYDEKLIEDKYLVTHKVDWRPGKKVHLFAGEQIVYGSRSINPSYLLPHTFMRVTEHNLRNRDNVLIFIGGNFELLPSNTLYFNLSLDELSKSELFGNWWGNKYAFQIGNSYQLNHRQSRLAAEFVAVRPWMYTHNILVNKFSHERQGLGYPDGSNLLKYIVELNLDLTADFDLDLQTSYRRQGSVGNDFSINYNDRPSDEANWLEGEITDVLAAGTVLTWQISQHHKLKLGYRLQSVRDADNDGTFSLSYQTIY
ncbi:MAG: hypothetical protein R6U84_01210 [Candidatus Cloacimonadales bacterium]